MRIAQMIDTVNIGGAQKMQVVLAEAMRGQDVELTLISLKENARHTPMPDKLQQLGVKVKYFPAKKLLSIRRLWQIHRFLKDGNYDLVHAHLTYANIIGTLSGWLAGIPTIASFRSIKVDENRFRARLESFLLRYVTTRLMSVGYATSAAQQYRMGDKKIASIPNSVAITPDLPDEDRVAIRRALTGDPERTILIAVGRLVHAKGFDTLLNAFATVCQDHSATLLIAGEGPLREQLANQIIELELTGQVQLLGQRHDVSNLLGASDIFVNASRWEGLSNALLEAMAAGLPVVATNNSDTPRVVVEGTGLLIPANDEEALAQALSMLLGDTQKQQRFGMGARQHMIDNYNVTHWVEQILDLWQSALNSKEKVS